MHTASAIGYVSTQCSHIHCSGRSFGQYAWKLTDVRMLFQTLIIVQTFYPLQGLIMTQYVNK